MGETLRKRRTKDFLVAVGILFVVGAGIFAAWLFFSQISAVGLLLCINICLTAWVLWQGATQEARTEEARESTREWMIELSDRLDHIEEEIRR